MLAAMRRLGLSRRLTALLAIVALVFAQAAVAAHGCALPAPPDVAEAPCHEPGDPASDGLCKAHCEAGTQSVDQAKPFKASDAGAPLIVLRPDNFARPASVPAARMTDWLAHAGAPPPFLLHRRLRI